MEPYDDVLCRLNLVLTPPVRPARAREDDGSDVDDPNDFVRGSPVVRGTYCQMYNQISHRVRDEARYHSVQLGLMTTTFAGASANTRKNKNRFLELRRHTGQRLPQERINDKVAEGLQSEALRIEQSFVVDAHRLIPEHKNGATLYGQILEPLCRRMLHPSVMGPLGECIQPFQPQVIHKLFIWATYPIASLIKWMWEDRLKNSDVVFGTDVSPYNIEFMAMLERTLNYGHTGSGRVLSRRLMDRAFMSLGIVHDGFPCINSAYISFGDLSSRKVLVNTAQWPMNTSTMRPLTCSKRAQELTYDEKHYQKYEALFTIRHSISYMPRDTFSDVGDEDMRHSCYAFNVAIAVYVKEVKDLVYAKVTEEVQKEIESRDAYRSERASRRQDALRIWMGEPQPLSTTPHTVLHLIRTVCPGNTGGQAGNTGVQLTPAKVNGQNSQPLDFLVKLMIKFATSPTKQMGPLSFRTVSPSSSSALPSTRSQGCSPPMVYSGHISTFTEARVDWYE
ncbi:hypothetical protein HYDPIDRAFT_44798 [Hydnomerulius pinastri MD-312]|uniref:Uncharacterized protein n=1 Tax=Hydnomerulius pinastri MD-312 TaxID=994086 RepID=A0A0C9VWW1_9AGAM|nr:hypothetical protein HYDPIDRAFT_44798 [Hydnomerulius pinastri MD-312]